MSKLTTKLAAERAGVSSTRIQQLILDGKLSAEKIGRDWMIEEDELSKVSIYGKAGRPPKPRTDAPSAPPRKRGRKPKANGKS